MWDRTADNENEIPNGRNQSCHQNKVTLGRHTRIVIKASNGTKQSRVGYGQQANINKAAEGPTVWDHKLQIRRCSKKRRNMYALYLPHCRRTLRCAQIQHFDEIKSARAAVCDLSQSCAWAVLSSSQNTTPFQLISRGTVLSRSADSWSCFVLRWDIPFTSRFTTCTKELVNSIRTPSHSGQIHRWSITKNTGGRYKTHLILLFIMPEKKDVGQYSYKYALIM